MRSLKGVRRWSSVQVSLPLSLCLVTENTQGHRVPLKSCPVANAASSPGWRRVGGAGEPAMSSQDVDRLGTWEWIETAETAKAKSPWVRSRGWHGAGRGRGEARQIGLPHFCHQAKTEMWQEGKRLGRRALLYSLLWHAGVEVLADSWGTKDESGLILGSSLSSR